MADHIGTRVRYWRVRRGGMSQAALAGLAGVSQPFISQVEAGHKSIDKRSTLIAIADALQVTLADLLAAPGDPTDPQREKADTAVPAIRVILAELGEGERRTAARGADELDAAIAELSGHRVDANYAAMAMVLPGLLADAGAFGGVRLARVGYEASTCLKNLGYRDLALPATRVAVTGAQESEDPAWIGAATYFHTIALPMEAPGLSSRAAVRFLSDLQHQAADPRVRQMLGQLHLSAALTSIVDGRADDAAAHLAEAAAEAATLGDPDNGIGFNLLCFGPTNVGLWRMTVAAETGDHGKVVELAKGIEPRRLRVADRHFSYWLSLGRAYASLPRMDRHAMVALTNAEHAAPTAFARSQIVRDALAAMLYRAQRAAVPAELRVMCRRVGIEAPA